jgi:hypothetical protein
VKPEEFLPEYDSSLYVYRQDKPGDPQDILSSIDPRYCLTEKSAQDLVKVLADGLPAFAALVFDDFPKGVLGGPFQQSATVPWLRITQDGATIEVNAGMFAISYYAKSQPDQTPEQKAGTAAYYDGRARADLTQRLADAKAATS